MKARFAFKTFLLKLLPAYKKMHNKWRSPMVFVHKNKEDNFYKIYWKQAYRTQMKICERVIEHR